MSGSDTTSTDEAFYIPPHEACDVSASPPGDLAHDDDCETRWSWYHARHHAHCLRNRVVLSVPAPHDETPRDARSPRTLQRTKTTQAKAGRTHLAETQSPVHTSHCQITRPAPRGALVRRRDAIDMRGRGQGAFFLLLILLFLRTRSTVVVCRSALGWRRCLSLFLWRVQSPFGGSRAWGKQKSCGGQGFALRRRLASVSRRPFI
ncbi:hypothetical protein MSAN_02329500 [Mycena sanguinolenta]|uniref:Uncharacterized protein n=1 Tax=Mycena sanguinolenta TaxID=230812 RepID=A0A8H7CGX1_9AGAR|nr:hypothetical protein MSAN_02329500 [Mycena sanguinolenta]